MFYIKMLFITYQTWSALSQSPVDDKAFRLFACVQLLTVFIGNSLESVHPLPCIRRTHPVNSHSRRHARTCTPFSLFTHMASLPVPEGGEAIDRANTVTIASSF